MLLLKLLNMRHSNNNHQSKYTQPMDDDSKESIPNDDQLVNNGDVCANNVESNECDSGDSSIVADDEVHSNSLNSSTDDNRDELENNLNASNRMVAGAVMNEPAVGSDWYLYCDANFTNVNLIEEKIYEDLCYVTFSTTRPEVY